MARLTDISWEDYERLPLEAKKPLCIHAREAHKDAVALLRSEGARDAGGAED